MSPTRFSTRSLTRRLTRLAPIAALVCLALLGAACAEDGGAGAVATSPATSTQAPATPDRATEEAAQDPAAPTGERMRLVVTGERPHDPGAFTQGYELDGERLFESRGLYAAQEDVILTEVDPQTGEAIREVSRDAVSADVFAEGLTVMGDQIFQITWQSGLAFVYDVDTLERTGTFTYTGEGWGICDAGDVLHMSDGTSTLTTRDPDTFLPLGTVTVTLDGAPVDRINELECAGGVVWANVWQTNTILAIDPATGEVVGTVDASAIAQPNGRHVPDPSGADVLNGIAWDPIAETWLVTGKLWPVTYEVAFECTERCRTDVAGALPFHPRPGRPV